MKIKLFLASGDKDYLEHLSRVLAEKYTDVFEVSLCTSEARMRETLQGGLFDVALITPDFAANANLGAVRLPLLLCGEQFLTEGPAIEMEQLPKYQRISTMVGTVLEKYAEKGAATGSLRMSKARITAVWSPCGGTGKTSVALACAARRVAAGRQATYLNLENFSSTAVYFQENGKSISTAFGKPGADLTMFLMGIRQQDSGSGISYFCGPNNYDDMNILTADDLTALITACAASTDELIIDLSSQCDERVWKIFELADTVLLVSDSSSASQVKLRQFVNQHNIAQRIRNKSVLIANKGSQVSEPFFQRSIQLPLVQSGDAVSVYKTLSGNSFEW